MPNDHAMPTSEAQQHLGYRHSTNVGPWFRRRGIEPLPYRSPTGELLYPRPEAERALAHGSQQGIRRDRGYERVTHVRPRTGIPHPSDLDALRYLAQSPEHYLRAAGKAQPDPQRGILPNSKIGRLERHGWVKRTRRPEGGTIARITRKGRDVLREHDPDG